jgi:hypothetical protein
MGVGSVCNVQGEDAAAERLFRQARGILETLPDGEGAVLADCLAGLAVSLGHRDPGRRDPGQVRSEESGEVTAEQRGC